MLAQKTTLAGYVVGKKQKRKRTVIAKYAQREPEVHMGYTSLLWQVFVRAFVWTESGVLLYFPRLVVVPFVRPAILTYSSSCDNTGIWYVPPLEEVDLVRFGNDWFGNGFGEYVAVCQGLLPSAISPC